MAESVIGLYKTELVRNRAPWRGLDDLAGHLGVDWSNHRRLHGEIGMVLPAEYEAIHYRQDLSAELAETQ